MSNESGGTLNRSITGIKVELESATDSDNIVFSARSSFSESRNRFVELESISDSVISVSLFGDSVKTSELFFTQPKNIAIKTRHERMTIGLFKIDSF